MCKTRVVAAGLLICAAWGLRIAAQDAAHAEAVPQTSTSERLLREAERIVRGADQTSYSHTTRVDEAEGVYHLDCSGLLCYILKRVAPAHLKAIPVEKGHARALAVDFETAFAAAPSDPEQATCWLRIERLADARAGDCLAWKHESPQPGGSTGHVVLLVATPVLEADGQFRVTLIDATQTNHAEDTRSAHGGGGVGRGSMWFVVDNEGRPTGYRWSQKDGRLQVRPIAVARAVTARADGTK